MSGRTRLSQIQPLAFGRITRVLFGAGALYWAFDWGIESAGVIGFAALVILGLSFLVGGLMANPGCELSALPNLILPARRRFHFP